MKSIIFDTETTGLYGNRSKTLDKQPYIVEFYSEIYDHKKEEIVDSFYSYFRPGSKMDAGAKKVTGLTDEFLSDKSLFVKKIDQIEKQFENVDFVVGQNIMFDIQMMRFEFSRAGREFIIPSEKLIDLVEATEHIFGYRCRLGDLYEYLFGERFKEAHTAEADVKATTRVYLELLRRGEI